MGVGQWVVHNCEQPTRSQMFNAAKRDAGIPTSLSPSKQGWVNEFSGGEPQRIYQFDVDGTAKYIVEHLFDPNGRGPHFHVVDVKYVGQDLFQDGEKYLNLGKRDPDILSHYPEDVRGFK